MFVALELLVVHELVLDSHRGLGDGHLEMLACATVLAFSLVLASATAETMLLLSVASEHASLLLTLYWLSRDGLGALLNSSAATTVLPFALLAAAATAEAVALASVPQESAFFTGALLVGCDRLRLVLDHLLAVFTVSLTLVLAASTAEAMLSVRVGQEGAALTSAVIWLNLLALATVALGLGLLAGAAAVAVALLCVSQELTAFTSTHATVTLVGVHVRKVEALLSRELLEFSEGDIL